MYHIIFWTVEVFKSLEKRGVKCLPQNVVGTLLLSLKFINAYK